MPIVHIWLLYLHNGFETCANIGVQSKIINRLTVINAKYLKKEHICSLPIARGNYIICTFMTTGPQSNVYSVLKDVPFDCGFYKCYLFNNSFRTEAKAYFI